MQRPTYYRLRPLAGRSMGPLQLLTGSGAIALVALGLAMARFDEFRIARLPFLGGWNCRYVRRNMVRAYNTGPDDNSGAMWFSGWSGCFCVLTHVGPTVTQTRNEGWESAHKYIVGALIGAVLFVDGPELARWAHGGAFAQSQTQPAPNNSGPCSNFGANSGVMNCGTINLGPSPPGIKVVEA